MVGNSAHGAGLCVYISSGASALAQARAEAEGQAHRQVCGGEEVRSEDKLEVAPGEVWGEVVWAPGEQARAAGERGVAADQDERGGGGEALQ